MVMEWNVQRLTWQGQMLITKYVCVKFYDAAYPLYLVTDAPSISLVAGFLQVREGINCGCDKIPDNVTLCPIAFAIKSPSSMEPC